MKMTDLHLRAASEEAMMAALRTVGLTATDEDGVERARQAGPGFAVDWRGALYAPTGDTETLEDGTVVPVRRPIHHDNAPDLAEVRAGASAVKSNTGRTLSVEAPSVHVNVRTTDPRLMARLRPMGVLIETPATPHVVWAE